MHLPPPLPPSMSYAHFFCSVSWLVTPGRGPAPRSKMASIGLAGGGKGMCSKLFSCYCRKAERSAASALIFVVSIECDWPPSSGWPKDKERSPYAMGAYKSLTHSVLTWRFSVRRFNPAFSIPCNRRLFFGAGLEQVRSAGRAYGSSLQVSVSALSSRSLSLNVAASMCDTSVDVRRAYRWSSHVGGKVCF